MVVYYATDLRRFWSKVNVRSSHECWVWTGSTWKDGYGFFKFKGRRMGAHRYAKGFHDGVTPDPKLYCCHTCDNPICVNPGHLFWGTAKDNNQDAVKKGRWSGGNALKTHCIHGHEFTKANTYLRKQGGRQCRKCTLDKGRD